MDNGRSNDNNSNVWWNLAHLGLGEAQMEISQSFDCWTNINLQQEMEEVMTMNPHVTITNINGCISKKHQSTLYAAGGSHVYPDPHLTCLKLGSTNRNKRRQYYFEDGTTNIISTTTSTSTTTTGDGVSLLRVGLDLDGGGSGSSSTVVIPKCQVDGCHVEILCAREYYRRHKVCEVHSKATKVEVLGIEQRFCQQCSRFHGITEFDDSKRSCRRRLAGHNERRRKISSSSSSNDSTTAASSIISRSRKCFDKVLQRPTSQN